MAPEQLPGKKSGHMLQLLCHREPLGTVCLQQEPDHMCFRPGNHLDHYTTKHGYSGVVKESSGEWIGDLFSSMTRVDFVIMRVMDAQVYGLDLMRVFFRGVFAHDTQAPPQASWYGGGASVIGMGSDLDV